MAMPAIETLRREGVSVKVAIHPMYRPLLKVFNLEYIDVADSPTPPFSAIKTHITDWWLDQFDLLPTRSPIVPVGENPFNLPDRYIVISPGSGSEYKRVADLFWNKVAAGCDLPIVIIGSESEKRHIESLVRNVPGINLVGRDTPDTLIHILHNAEAVITTDTAISHLADAMSKFTITVFNHPNHKKFKPFWNAHVAFTPEDVLRYLAKTSINTPSN